MTSFSAPLPLSPAPHSRSASPTNTHTATWIFGIMAAVFLSWPVWRIGFLLDANLNEAWHAWYIDAAQNGTPLYPAPGELIVNNYPPLSYYLTALGAKLTGDTILAGRLISLASFFVFCWAAGVCIRALGGSRGAAAFGAFWLAATLSRFFALYVGVNDPSLLGIALMGLGLAYFLHLLQAGRVVEPAIALMVAAGFVKHNFPAIPVAALIWLGLSDKRAALRAGAFGAGLAAAGLMLCAAAYGPDFARNMTMPREVSLGHVPFALNRLQWIAPAILIWGLWAWPKRKKPAAQFTALLLGLCLVNGLITAAGAGVTYNAYLGAVFASGIGVALAFEGIGNTPIASRFGTGAVQTAIAAALVLRLVLSQQAEAFYVLASSSFRNEIRQEEAVFKAEIARIRAIPGPLLCQPQNFCYRAGKAFVYDKYWMEQLIATGVWTRDGVSKAMGERGIRLEQTDPRAAPGKRRLF